MQLNMLWDSPVHSGRCGHSPHCRGSQLVPTSDRFFHQHFHGDGMEGMDEQLDERMNNEMKAWMNVAMNVHFVEGSTQSSSQSEHTARAPERAEDRARATYAPSIA